MISFIWLKRRKAMDISEEEKIKNAYNSLNAENQKAVLKKANTQIGVYTAIAGIVILAFLIMFVVALVTKEGLYEKVISIVFMVFGGYMLFCDLTWVKAENHEKMMLVFDYAKGLAEKQDNEEALNVENPTKVEKPNKADENNESNETK